MHAAGERQHAREHGAARGHAHDIGCDTGRKSSALAGEVVQMRCTHPTPLETVAITSVLIAHDEQDIGTIHKSQRQRN